MSEDRNFGYRCDSWNARVGNMSRKLLRSSVPLEQKNVLNIRLFRAHLYLFFVLPN